MCLCRMTIMDPLAFGFESGNQVLNPEVPRKKEKRGRCCQRKKKKEERKKNKRSCWWMRELECNKMLLWFKPRVQNRSGRKKGNIEQQPLPETDRSGHEKTTTKKKQFRKRATPWMLLRTVTSLTDWLTDLYAVPNVTRAGREKIVAERSHLFTFIAKKKTIRTKNKPTNWTKLTLASKLKLFVFFFAVFFSFLVGQNKIRRRRKNNHINLRVVTVKTGERTLKKKKKDTKWWTYPV